MRFNLTEYAESPTPSVMSLAEAKLHLRVDFNDDDALIESLIEAATLAAEAYTSAGFTERSYLMTLGAWPGLGAGSFGPDEDGDEWPSRFGTSGRPSRWPNAIHLPVRPLVSVSAITYLDSDGAVQTLATDQYVVVTAHRPPFIVPAEDATWPPLARHPEAVRVAFRAGFSECPANAVAGIKLILGHLYAHREDVTTGVGAPEPAVLPMGSTFLLAPHRMWL